MTVVAKYRQVARKVKTLIVMIKSEKPSKCIGKGPAQNHLQAKEKL